MGETETNVSTSSLTFMLQSAVAENNEVVTFWEDQLWCSDVIHDQSIHRLGHLQQHSE